MRMSEEKWEAEEAEKIHDEEVDATMELYGMKCDKCGTEFQDKEMLKQALGYQFCNFCYLEVKDHVEPFIKRRL